MMETVVVWLLIAVSDGYYNKGNVFVVERFLTQRACEDVRGQIPKAGEEAKTRCIRAELPARLPQR